MRDLANIKGSVSQVKFDLNGGSTIKPANNITINIANLSNRNDVDYMVNQLSMLDLG